MIRLIATCLLLTGCGALGPDGRMSGAGGASYEYKRTLADGSTCVVSLVSGRDIQGGDLEIGKDCELLSHADSTKGTSEALQVIDNGITLSREIIQKIPKGGL